MTKVPGPGGGEPGCGCVWGGRPRTKVPGPGTGKLGCVCVCKDGGLRTKVPRPEDGEPRCGCVWRRCGRYFGVCDECEGVCVCVRDEWGRMVESVVSVDVSVAE